MEEGGTGRFGALIEKLEDAAIELQDATDSLSEEALTDLTVSLADLSDGDREVVEDIFEQLDDGLQADMRKAFDGGITEDEAFELAEHLTDEDMIDEDSEPAVAAVIYRLSEHVATLPAEAEESETNQEVA